MTAALVFLHGRRQEFKDVEALKRMWVKGLNAGLELSDLPSVDVNHVTMPFYGNVLYHVTAGSTGTPIRLESPDAPAPFHPNLPKEVSDLERELLRDQAAEAGVQLTTLEVVPESIGDRLLSWGAARRVLDGLARRTRVDQAIITDYLRDVAVYLTLGRDQVLRTVREAIPKEGELVLVTHSLGTAVGRDLLVDDAIRSRVRLWMTTGSPLGLDAVRKNLLSAEHPGLEWVSCYDVNDIVALGHPLRPKWGAPLTDIEVDNAQEPHSIREYLAHADVAEHIGRALTR